MQTVRILPCVLLICTFVLFVYLKVNYFVEMVVYLLRMFISYYTVQSAFRRLCIGVKVQKLDSMKVSQAKHQCELFLATCPQELLCVTRATRCFRVHVHVLGLSFFWPVIANHTVQ